MSSIDEVAQRWNHRVYKGKNKAESSEVRRTFRAEDNLLRAVERLKFYKQNLFNVKEHKQGHHGHKKT